MPLAGADTAQVITAIGVVITAILGGIAAIISAYALVVVKRAEVNATRRETKLDEVHYLTNGLSERNEANARKAGAAEQKEADRAGVPYTTAPTGQ